jgi:predicted RNase H-like HicB family nuclease
MSTVKLEDYTLRVTHRQDWDSWEAELLEFFALKAAGQTRDEAMQELERLFSERIAYLEAAGKPLPVPGEEPEMMFSTSAQIDAQAGMARDFFSRVLGISYDDVFVSDATRLEEFGALEDLRASVKTVYDVDIGPELERPLWMVLGQIRDLVRGFDA